MRQIRNERWNEIERERESSSYAKLVIESERRRRGMTRSQRRSVRKDEGDETVEEVAQLKLLRN